MFEYLMKLVLSCIPFHAPLGAYKKGVPIMANSQIAQGKPILDSRGKLRPWMQADLRAKIQASAIINLLQRVVLDGEEVNPIRITAGLALLRKVLPDAMPDIVVQSNQQVMPQQLQAKASQLLESITVSYTVSRETLSNPDIIQDAITLPADVSKIAEDANGMGEVARDGE